MSTPGKINTQRKEKTYILYKLERPLDVRGGSECEVISCIFFTLLCSEDFSLSHLPHSLALNVYFLPTHASIKIYKLKNTVCHDSY
jgi:hypothetical protein